MIPKEDKEELATTWFQDSAEAPVLFMKIRDFEVDCRKFLLAVNSSIAMKLVFSLPVLRCKLRNQELFKPPGENYPTFWADFNIGSSSISLYCVREKEVEEGMSWELVVIPQEQVVGVSLTCPEGGMEVVLLIFTLAQGHISSTAEMEFPGDCSGQLHSLLAQIFGSRYRKVETVSDEHGEGERCFGVPVPEAHSQSLEEVTSIPPSPDSSDSHQSSLPCAQPRKPSPLRKSSLVRKPSSEKNHSPVCKTRPGRKSSPGGNPSSARKPIKDTISRAARRSNPIRKPTPKTPKPWAKARLSVGKAREYGPVVVISQKKRLGEEKEHAPDSPVGGDASKAAKGDCLKGMRTGEEIVLTPEMQGCPGLRGDVEMTLSGGRKRAIRKISASDRLKLQARVKPSHLKFQPDLPLAQENREVSKSTLAEQEEAISVFGLQGNEEDIVGISTRTLEMQGCLQRQEDVEMTSSGGRKISIKRISDSAGKEVQSTAKAAQVEVQVKNTSKEGTSTGQKLVKVVKSQLSRVPSFQVRKRSERRVSVSPSLMKIPEISTQRMAERRMSSSQSREEAVMAVGEVDTRKRAATPEIQLSVSTPSPTKRARVNIIKTGQRASNRKDPQRTECSEGSDLFDRMMEEGNAKTLSKNTKEVEQSDIVPIMSVAVQFSPDQDISFLMDCAPQKLQQTPSVQKKADEEVTKGVPEVVVETGEKKNESSNRNRRNPDTPAVLRLLRQTVSLLQWVEGAAQGPGEGEGLQEGWGIVREAVTDIDI